MTRTLIAIILIGASSSAFSQDDLFTGRYDNCMENSGGVTVTMLNCMDEEMVTQDARLNGVYKKLMEQLTTDRSEQLRTAQRIWIKYRDANCHFYADPNGGTIATVNASACFLSETAERASELENFLTE